MFQHDFILIDQSGSMQSLWIEALSSVNAYVRKLAKDKIDTGVTVAMFDSNVQGHMKFRIVRDRITPKTFRPLTNDDGRPTGGTPLSDATVKIVQLAENGTYDKVSLIIMTDGDENSSTQYSVSEAKAALDRCRERDWAVTFLGADFQNDNQAVSYGGSLHSAVSSTRANLGHTLEAMGTKRAFYASASVGNAAETTMTWTPEEKKKAAE